MDCWWPRYRTGEQLVELMSPQKTITSTRQLPYLLGQRRVFSWLVAVKLSIAIGLIVSGSTFGQEPLGPEHRSADQSREDLDKLLRQNAREKWGSEVEKLRQLDQIETYPDDAILFLGSSSIRLWDGIAEDLAPLVPIRRGFGGAQSVDLAVFGPELLQAHRYSMLVVFVANDISGEDGKSDHSPDDVLTWMREVWQASQQHQPDAPLLVIEVTPTNRRRHVWELQRILNHRLRDWTLQEPNVYFLPTAEYFLDSQDQVRSELFVEDRLHLSRQGYQLWGSLIRRRIHELQSGVIHPQK